jgi:uncharacterized membrane protein
MASESADPPDESKTTARSTGESLYRTFLDTVLTGVAITIPLIITLYVLRIGLDFVHGALQPVIGLLQWFGVIERFESVTLIRVLIDLGIYAFVIDFLTEIITILLLFGVVVVVGTVGRNRYGERVIGYVDLAIAAIPGIGTVYKSFRRMGDVMLNDNAENFQDVKLVQCLEENVYVLGFKTSSAPVSIETSTGHEDMVSMFLPLAPNPVTGGFLTYVPEEDVYDIDMTIEEGVRSILTSGIATGENASEIREVTMGDLGQIADVQNLQDALAPKERDFSGGDAEGGEYGPGDPDQ